MSLLANDRDEAFDFAEGEAISNNPRMMSAIRSSSLRLSHSFVTACSGCCTSVLRKILKPWCGEIGSILGWKCSVIFLLRIERGKRQPYAKRWMTNDDKDGTLGIPCATVPRHDKECSGRKDVAIYFSDVV